MKFMSMLKTMGFVKVFMPYFIEVLMCGYFILYFKMVVFIEFLCEIVNFFYCDFDYLILLDFALSGYIDFLVWHWFVFLVSFL